MDTETLLPRLGPEKAMLRSSGSSKRCTFLCLILIILLLVFAVLTTRRYYLPDYKALIVDLDKPVQIKTSIATGITLNCPFDGCVRPFVPMAPLWIASKGDQIAACKIEKNMSTFLTAMMCYLNRTEEFLAAGRALHSESWNQRYCRNTIEFIEENRPFNLSDLPPRQTKSWHTMVIVRDPLDRFVSGFVEKCLNTQPSPGWRYICYRCFGDISCFLNELLHRLKSFVLKPQRHIEAQHFAPQTWYCGFENIEYKLINYGTDHASRDVMNRQIAEFLEQSGVERR
ncbi:unnamed protein product, partial [Mesorhabditis spiculigera]